MPGRWLPGVQATGRIHFSTASAHDDFAHGFPPHNTSGRDGRPSLGEGGLFGAPGRALADGIFMTPTLLRLAASPLRKIVGTFSDTATLMQALDLPEPGTSASART